MKLGFCYKTKDGLYSMEVDKELLGVFEKAIERAIQKEMVSPGVGNIRKLGLLCDMWIELDELPDKPSESEMTF